MTVFLRASFAAIDGHTWMPYARLAVLAVLLLALIPAGAQAQTPAATLENQAGDTRLQLNYDGGLVVPGLFDPPAPNDSIPATGAGTRLMWYPAKAAFRAGRVGDDPDKGDVWDPDSIGTSSVAFGADTRASGRRSTAMGNRTIASGLESTAMGFHTRASGFRSTAMGEGTRASAAGATAMGDETIASGRNTTAMGDETIASGSIATAMGNQTEASASYSTAMGNLTVASGMSATAMGRDTKAVTDRSVSIGQLNSANTSADGTLLVAGNGSGSRSDALVLDFDGNLEIAGTLTESSDRRLKTGIEPLDGGVLQRLANIRPVRFRFKPGTGHPTTEQLGVIAQEVQKQFPTLVREGSQDYLSVAYPKLTAVLLKGMQEQQEQLRDKQAQIDALRDRVQQIEDLQQRLARLESRPGRSLLAGVPATGVVLAVVALFGAGLFWTRRR